MSQGSLTTTSARIVEGPPTTAVAAERATTITSTTHATPATEDVAREFIGLALAGDTEGAFRLATDDVVIAGCDVLEAWYHILPATGGLGVACPENGSRLASSALKGYLSFVAAVGTSVTSIECHPFDGQPFFLVAGQLADPLECRARATNRLLGATGETYVAGFVFGFEDGLISGIEEVGHSVETVPNNWERPIDVASDPPPPELLEACQGVDAVDVVLESDQDSLFMFEPGIADESPEWWTSRGTACAEAWIALAAIDN